MIILSGQKNNETNPGTVGIALAILDAEEELDETLNIAVLMDESTCCQNQF